eukprot:scaffold11019_cov75-Phaeocystis_antarctica.AAC.13
MRFEEGGELPRRRVVEDQRARQRRRALAERLLQLVAQLHRAQRVEPRLQQRRVRIDRAGRRARRQREYRLKGHRRRRHYEGRQPRHRHRPGRPEGQQKRRHHTTTQHAPPRDWQHCHHRRRRGAYRQLQRSQPLRQPHQPPPLRLQPR